MWYFIAPSKMNRWLSERRCGLALSALFLVAALVNPCGAQTPPSPSSPSFTPAPPPVQNQVGPPSQGALQAVTPSAGVSAAGPTSVPAPGVGSSTSSSFGMRFGSAGQGL